MSEIDHIKNIKQLKTGTKFEYKSENYRIPLLGKHQTVNAALAIEAVKVFDEKIPKEVIEKGLLKTFWPGRIQKIMDNVYFDVALVSMNVSVVLFAAWAIFPGAMLYAIICRKQKGVEPRRSLSERLVIAGLKNRDNMTRVIPSDSVETPDTGTKAQVWVEEKS